MEPTSWRPVTRTTGGMLRGDLIAPGVGKARRCMTTGSDAKLPCIAISRSGTSHCARYGKEKKGLKGRNRGESRCRYWVGSKVLRFFRAEALILWAKITLA